LLWRHQIPLASLSQCPSSFSILPFFQPTLDSTWVAHPITNDSNVTNDTSNNNDNINNAKNYTTKNHTPSSWAVRPAPVVVVDLGPHWASNAQMSQAAWTHAGREALELLQVVH